MLLTEIKTLPSGQKELKRFSGLMGIVLVGLGLLLLVKGKDNYLILFAFSAAFLGAGFLFPSAVKPLYRFWMTLGLVLGWVMTSLLLLLIFYLVLTPMGLILRLCGVVFLNTRWEQSKETCWIRKNGVLDRTRSEKQF